MGSTTRSRDLRVSHASMAAPALRSSTNTSRTETSARFRRAPSAEPDLPVPPRADLARGRDVGGGAVRPRARAFHPRCALRWTRRLPGQAVQLDLRAG